MATNQQVIQYGHDDLITSSSSNGRAGRSSEEGKQQQSDADGEVKTQHVVVMGGKNKPNLVETDVRNSPTTLRRPWMRESSGS